MAAYFINSAALRETTINLAPFFIIGSYSFLRIGEIFFELLVPITTLSGYLKSLRASPSLKNSGFETTSNLLLGLCLLKIFSILSPVPRGTVDFVIIVLCLLRFFEIVFVTLNTLDRSADWSFFADGVPTAIKMMSEFCIALSISVVKISLFALKFLLTISSSPGS